MYTLHHTLLTVEQREELSTIVKGAFAVGVDLNYQAEDRTALIDDDTVIGFYTPYQLTYNGQQYWRPGSLYLIPTARDQGFMESVLKEFIKTHSPVICWIEDMNERSINLFKKLDFLIEPSIHSPQVNGRWWKHQESNCGNNRTP